MSESSTVSRWEFYTRIAEGAETMRRHAGEFAKNHLPPELTNTATMMSYHLRQVENQARSLAGPRPTERQA